MKRSTSLFSVSAGVTGARWRGARSVPAGLTAILLLAAMCSMVLAPVAGAGGGGGYLRVEFGVDTEWNTGFTGSMQVENHTPDTLSDWNIAFDMPHEITSLWNAVESSHQGDRYTLAHPSWQGDIPPGSSASFGFVASSNGTVVTPSNCAVNGIACEINADTPIDDPEPPEPPDDPGPPPPEPPDDPVDPPGEPPEKSATVAFVVSSDWGSGYTAQMTIANNSTENIDGWKLEFTLGSRITCLWNGSLSGASPSYAVTNASWNGTIASGGKVEFGFNGDYSGALETPTGFVLNGYSLGDPPDDPVDPPDDPVDPPDEPPDDPVDPPEDPPDEPVPPPPPPENLVVGYFTSWSVYDRDYHVSDVPADRVTHINYAFANISSEGRLVLGDPYADIDKFYPGDSWDSGALRGNFHQLQLLKERHPHVETLISVGGWTWSGMFPQVAATPEARRRFAESCVDFVTSYGFDGVDVDWEYPGPSQKDDFTALMRELRTQLDARGETDGRHYLLTIAAPAGESNYVNLNLPVTKDYLDWVNIMTYDFHGGWDTTTNFNAPLYPHPDDPSPWWSVEDFNVDATVRGYKETGVPADKIVIGVPFYGRGWSGVPDINEGLFQAASGIPMGTWESGVFDYKDLEENYVGNGYTRYWSDEAKVPWLYNPATGIMITYDDPESLAYKARYARDNGLGGVMIWSLDCDNAEGSLINSL